MDSHEQAIQLAIQELNSGVFKSQRAAAKAYGLAQSTLQRRIHGTTNHATGHQNQQRLAPIQEDYLVEWILEEDSRACPPSHARAREMANRILRANGDDKPVGKLWLSHFLRRQPRVASVIGRKLEAKRASAATPEQIRAFLELFQATQKRLNIKTQNIYNMDETGIALGVCTNTRVLSSSKKKRAFIQSPENREWVSVIECVSATGQKLRGAVIFKGQSLQTTWFPSSSIPDWLYTTSENGWTSNDIGVEWLQRIFIPETQPAAEEYRLLILDGHGSHIDIEFLWLCKQNKIELLYLPAHSSHALQPLDLAPFSVIKSRYRRQIQELASLDDAAPVKKERFITCYYHAREEGFTERVIRAGWQASGMCPFNINRVLPQRPTTPTQQQQQQQEQQEQQQGFLSTPKSHRDIYLAQRDIQDSENLGERTAKLLQKAGKALALANARAVGLEAEKQKLQQKLEATSSQRSRKRVQIDPNQRFAEVETILEAAREAKASRIQKRKPATPKASKNPVVDRAPPGDFNSMCIEWQL